MDLVGLLTRYEPFLYAGIILLVTWAVASIVRGVIGGAMAASNPQAAAAASRTGAVIVWVIGAVLAVQEVGISTTILLVLVALAGAATIVAVREPLENATAKYFSDIYLPFRVGDTIEIGPRAGTVIEINPISTILLSKDDQLYSVPNSTFLRQVLVNTSPQAWKEVAIPISAGGALDLPTFESSLMKSLNKLRPRFDRRFPPTLAVRSRSPQSTELTLTVMLRSPEERATVITEVNTRVAEVLDQLSRSGRTGARSGPSA